MKLTFEESIARAYYHIKPFMSRSLQIRIRRLVARQKRLLCRNTWPINPKAGDRPPGFPGWPGGKRFAVVLTHDVDTARGVGRCEQLMLLERELGFRSSFFFVAHDYTLPQELRHYLVKSGFEVGLHGLEHNRKLYESPKIFADHAKQINVYLKEWGAVGFRSPCVYHNFEWLHGLDISYEASAFDTDPFEPQSDALGTIFPVHQKRVPGREYVVLPYTLPQDFTMFILFQEKGIDIWKQKLRWIAERGGMALLITHPDYMRFDGTPNFDEYSSDLYRELLVHIQEEYKGEYWQPLPQEMASFWTKSVADVKTVGRVEEVAVERPIVPVLLSGAEAVPPVVPALVAAAETAAAVVPVLAVETGAILPMPGAEDAAAVVPLVATEPVVAAILPMPGAETAGGIVQVSPVGPDVAGVVVPVAAVCADLSGLDDGEDGEAAGAAEAADAAEAAAFQRLDPAEEVVAALEAELSGEEGGPAGKAGINE